MINKKNARSCKNSIIIVIYSKNTYGKKQIETENQIFHTRHASSHHFAEISRQLFQNKTIINKYKFTYEQFQKNIRNRATYVRTTDLLFIILSDAKHTIKFIPPQMLICYLIRQGDNLSKDTMDEDRTQIRFYYSGCYGSTYISFLVGPWCLIIIK